MHVDSEGNFCRRSQMGEAEKNLDFHATQYSTKDNKSLTL